MLIAVRTALSGGKLRQPFSNLATSIKLNDALLQDGQSEPQRRFRVDKVTVTFTAFGFRILGTEVQPPPVLF